MKTGTTGKIISIFVMLILLIIIFYMAGRTNGYKAGYKQGQIDALTKNKIIYCLKTDTLNQSTWQLCEE